MKKALFFTVAAVSLLVAGCADQNAEYEQKVELTPEQQAAADKNMQGQQAPGQLDPGQPADAVAMPPGKGGS